MADDRDSGSLIEAAQRAAADGDYVAAERLLREAADLQEAAFGPSDSALATTLNNLAFVCEHNGKFDEAERGYRRAHAIAVASLRPGHPFIKTSLSNLMEFCDLRGIPIWTPPATPTEDEPLHDEDNVEPPPIEIPAEVVHEAATLNPPALARRFPPRRMAVAAVAVVAIALAVFARQGQGTTDGPPPSLGPSPLPGPSPSRSPSRSPGPAPAPASSRGPSSAPSPPPARHSSRDSLAPSGGREPVTVLKAQLCSALEKRGSPDWECTSASGDQRPGTFMFYTRLLTTTATTVEHRWYRDGRVHQSMRLRVPAAPRSGYRTFSSNTVSVERAGEWKVELRGSDGTVVHEEHFVVR